MPQYQVHCRVLEVPEGASQAEIAKAYRLMVKVWHPDRFEHDAELRASANEKLQAINAAYEFLRNNTWEPTPLSDLFTVQAAELAPRGGGPNKPRTKATPSSKPSQVSPKRSRTSSKPIYVTCPLCGTEWKSKGASPRCPHCYNRIDARDAAEARERIQQEEISLGIVGMVLFIVFIVIAVLVQAN